MTIRQESKGEQGPTKNEMKEEKEWGNRKEGKNACIQGQEKMEGKEERRKSR